MPFRDIYRQPTHNRVSALALIFSISAILWWLWWLARRIRFWLWADSSVCKLIRWSSRFCLTLIPSYGPSFCYFFCVSASLTLIPLYGPFFRAFVFLQVLLLYQTFFLYFYNVDQVSSFINKQTNDKSEQTNVFPSLSCDKVQLWNLGCRNLQCELI